MRTLIINGSPRKNGDTAHLLAALKTQLHGEITELSAYYGGVSPCIDCRACQTIKGCVIRDGMQAVYDDGYDNVVIASPIYMSGLTGPLVGLASRFQAYYCARRFLQDPFVLKKKKGALIFTGGGDGAPGEALRLGGWMLGQMNAEGGDGHTALSLHTDRLPAAEDTAALAQVREIAAYFNGDV